MLPLTKEQSCKLIELNRRRKNIKKHTLKIGQQLIQGDIGISDYHEGMRISQEELDEVTEEMKKLRDRVGK